MGVHFNVYIGPYLDVPCQIVTRTNIKTCCENETCKNHNTTIGGNFCNVCGSKVVSVSYEESYQESFDIYAFCEEHFDNGDMFTELNEMIVGNNKKDLVKYGENEFTIDLSNINQSKPYSENWKKLLELLDEQGVKYEYHFGAMGFWH